MLVPLSGIVLVKSAIVVFGIVVFFLSLLIMLALCEQLQFAAGFKNLLVLIPLQ